ncbi:MAG: acetate kinase [Parachlamydiaceae bacterium]|nr:acetate kinase [Parachlamydiaceae bacterium]
MKILALNSGSSSIKYRLFDSGNFLMLRQGLAERIGQKTSSICQIEENQPARHEEIALPDYRTAIHALFSEKSLSGIEAMGHRVVHGGEQFKGPTLVDSKVIKDISELAKFAPLHCQPNVIGIEMLRELLPDIPHVAIFDTATHATMGSKAYLYGLPFEYYEKHKIRKYGFHGINHAYVAQEASRLLKKRFEELKIVTCHLGNGCSINAFEKGKSIDNSMGLTPLEGLVMGTRCGDLDPSVVIYLIEELGLPPQQVTDLLNKKSGLLGLCGKSDMRDIIAMAKGGDTRSQIAIELFVYRVQKYIGAYIAALNGIDAIIFSGGIGENSSHIRNLIARNFSYVGAHVEPSANENNKSIFSTTDSPVVLMTIPANEEKVIAQQTYQLLKQNEKVKI